MTTPICDFVRRYADSGMVRMHMPGHKGHGPLGIEHLDITEICGADSLYEAEGIIRESEQNASVLFGCPTYYSTEGSSHAIRAMLYLIVRHALSQGKKPRVWAARNAHKVFLSAVALLDVEVGWLVPSTQDSYLCCRVDAAELDLKLASTADKPVALYLTSPDYLGNVADVAAIAEVCHRHGVLLAVDNAHGAYLHFLPVSRHPIALGADVCADSAHKTLPVLTGGAYLHISPSAPALFCEQAKTALSLFGSTSPSYLILQSLDTANAVLCDDFPTRLARLVERLASLRARLGEAGYVMYGDEPTKLTLLPKSYGYDGYALAELLRRADIECEFCDPDALVLMLSPSTDESDIDRLEHVLLNVPRHDPITTVPPSLSLPKQQLSTREAMLAPSELIDVHKSEGRILASPSVGCPPAVPIVMSGERIGADVLACFDYYGVKQCLVVK